ncbi:leptomycin B resistance protein pmd1 [Lentithecium fluviatile CBS 122367]|uniref:Leptomycin B resistance protein pmd1 n=1 Tax=Lentithecium fluviatile CBS 122367 TaxID=1168545 RepID=A0A6G1JAB7_9PLEO|nr:leptomycin B resistance protein pmd1 [Lentithecium fluviatile CBS 122367]
MDASQVLPANPHNAILGEHLIDDASERHMQHESELDGPSIFQSSQWDGRVGLVSLRTAQPEGHREPRSGIVCKKFIRQILGLNPFKTSYFTLYKPLQDFESRFILLSGLLLAVSAGLPLPLISVILGKIINDFPPKEDELRLRLAELLGVAVAYFVITWGWTFCWAVVGERLSRKTRERLVERTLGMDQAYFDTISPDITNILTEKMQAIQLGTSEKVGLFIASISYFIAAFSAGFVLNAKLAGVMLLTVVPAISFIVIYGTKYVTELSKQSSALTEQATAVADSAFRGVQIVQAFGISDRLAKDHIIFLRKALRAGVRKSIAGAAMVGSIYFVAYAANAMGFWYGDRLRQGSAEAGTIYAVVLMILDASMVVGRFGPFIQTFAVAAAAGETVSEILDHPTADIDVYSPEGNTVRRADFEQNLKLQGVTFVYPARPTERVLQDVSIEFPAGKVTGLVGPSGSGKSTIAALLLRLYDPPSGQVQLGKEDLKGMNVKSLRSRIALVTQSPSLFSGTILDNIKLGLPDVELVSEAEALARCTAAASDAHCDFIEHLPDGMHTKIGSGHHSQLSGGQKQRVALARALVGNPSLLLLDEYTSAMDATSEAAVLENLKRASAASGRTTIIIAHRLVTVKDADTIFVMKDGAVVQQGRHKDLSKADGLYAELIQAQRFEKKQVQSSSSSAISATESNRIDVSLKPKTLQTTLSREPTASHGIAKKNAAQLIGRCFALSRSEAPAIGVGLIASIVSGGITIGEALIFGNLIELLNDATNSPQTTSKIMFYCLLFMVLAIVALLSRTGGGAAFGLVSETLVVRVRDLSFQTVLIQDMAWFARPGHSHHDLMAKLNMDSGNLSGLSGIILGTLFTILTSVLGGIILAHLIAWRIALVLLSGAPIMLLAGFFRLRILVKAEERQQTAYNAAAALAAEACTAIQTVAALGKEEYFMQKYQAAIQQTYQESLRFSMFGNILLSFAVSVTYFVYAFAYWWGSQQVRNGNYMQREFFIVLPAVLFSAQAAGQLFSLAPEITRAKTAAQSLFALHDEKPTIIDSLNVEASKFDGEIRIAAALNSQTDPSRKGEVEFRGVSLHYATRPDVAALNDVSFSIRPGEFVAFVGRSGAGKSSTMHLIERFFDPTSGQILVDGHDVREEDVQAHRARLGLVEQEPDLFPGSVKFNIGLGAKPGIEVTDDDIIEVAKKCELHEFIMSLPEGYNTEVGAHGSKLSGGQRQRLAIARALIRDPEILLLDEATSQLDANTERQIRRAIAVASKGRTTIMIAHRLASVQHADRIFVFEHGKIVEHGKHDELVASWGIYSAMVAAQELD